MTNGNWRFWHRPLMVSDEEKWWPNDNTAKTRAGRAQHDPTRTAARSSYTGRPLKISRSSFVFVTIHEPHHG